MLARDLLLLRLCRRRRGATALGSALLLLSCGGSGPTAPHLDTPASIDGQVVAFGTSSPGTANDPVTGVTVRVEGTSLASVTNGQGRFDLLGVPMGDQMLTFERAGQTAALALDGIQPAERIAMVVALQGTTVQVQSLDRAAEPRGESGLSLEKSTNGEDADRPPGPSLAVGSPVSWIYQVTNTGAVELSRLEVSDNQGVAVTCPKTTLPPGASMSCSGAGSAMAGQYANVGTVTAVDTDGAPLTASDPSHYFGNAASIDLEKSTNGDDADKAPGPTIPIGQPVAWSYEVVNDGAVELSDIVVSDDQGVPVTCPRISLRPAESMTCTGQGIAVEGQYANLGMVTAVDADGAPVDDADPSHYFGAGSSQPFTAAVQPDHWNTNWPGSSGTVSVKIQGGDLASIDPSTIVLFEADPAVAAVPLNTPEITGNHIRPFFAQADAFAVLDDPQTGETRTVTIQFVAGGAVVQLQDQIEIVGPPI